MAENMSFSLTEQSQKALDNLTEVTGITNRADLINRAIQVYNLVASIQANGDELYTLPSDSCFSFGGPGWEDVRSLRIP